MLHVLTSFRGEKKANRGKLTSSSVAGLRMTSREVEKIRQHEGVKAVSGDNQVLFQVYRKQSIAVFSRKASCSN